ncbi:40S ribosomal protein S26 (nucleomorph) [Lotharella oceanica]|uniref:40S ribosomal protein S26 n=1 Tax=Lotharella oceanica TaxID=641309 RepID=A0A060DGB8_9EUKA|nr:40S ribosomal protein S26 [Lotharella oceanica]|mmetsp:Transcript_4220/g.8190  ORF Transcript_4220/g.8190 Transcript_4220/m.8190 type:complete len:102 (-) Transcript_4220:2849-3154(-)
MVRKRRNRGRSKHNRGHTRRIHCEEKNTLTPRDKAIKKLNIKNFTDPFATIELLNAILLPRYQIPKLYSYVFYCISYAYKKKIVKSRPKKHRNIIKDDYFI